MDEIEVKEQETETEKFDDAAVDAIVLPEESVALSPGSLKGKIEAALFITGKALSLQDLAELTEQPVEDVEMAVSELIQDIAFRTDSALEIDDTDGYILQIREDYVSIVNKMLPLELSAATIRTLSAIAIKAPILQSDLIELRGSAAYDHIAELLTRKMISKRRQGRSFILNTTTHFNEYFKLAGDKKELETLVRRMSRDDKPVPPPGTEIPEEQLSEVIEEAKDLTHEIPELTEAD